MLELATNRLPKLRAIANLYEALHENAIIYCNLKGNDRHLRISMTGESDIDILFDESQKERLEQILAGLEFKKFQAIKPKRYRQIVDFLALDEESGKVIHLHTHYGIPIGKPFLKNYQLDIEHYILSTRQLNGDFGTYCISPAYELILLYLNEAFKLRRRDLLPLYLNRKVNVSPKAGYEYHWLRKRTTDDEVDLAVRQIFPGQVDITGLLKGDFNRKGLLRLRPVLEQLLEKSSVYSPLRALTLRWSREITISMLRKLSRILPWPLSSLRFNPRGGIIVAIAGTDRAELSNITRMVRETFRKKIDVYAVDLEWHTDSSFTGKSLARGKEPRSASNPGAMLRARIKDVWRGIRLMAVGQKNAVKMIWAQAARQNGALVLCSHHFDNGLKGDTHLSFPGHLMQPGDPIVRFLARNEHNYHTKAKSCPPDVLFRVGQARQTMWEYCQEGKQAAPGNGFLPGKFKVMPIDGCEPVKQIVDTIKRETWNML